jgi:hypothetical protein
MLTQKPLIGQGWQIVGGQRKAAEVSLVNGGAPLKDEGERKSECLAFNLRLETSQAQRNRIFQRIRELMMRHLANRESRLP